MGRLQDKEAGRNEGCQHLKNILFGCDFNYLFRGHVNFQEGYVSNVHPFVPEMIRF